jgi:cytoskeletal protein RodZ
MSDFNSYGEEPVVGLAPLFFRVADRMRLEGYVAALVDDNMSLSLVSGHEAILDHYGRLLVARLREAAPHIGLEVYFPASADALITRFNEVLQSYSIEDAMGSKAPAAPAKVWIVHDASALPDHEIQLLARLVQHFPAANIRVVMLLTTASKKQQLLASFGRRILNWEIEPPSDEQAQLMLEQARAQGREGAVTALLKKIAPWGAVPTLPPVQPSAQSPVQPPVRSMPKSASVAEPEPDWTARAASAAAAPQAKPPRTRAGRGKWLLWLALAVALLATCALAVWALYGGALNADLWNLDAGKPAAVAPPVNTASAAASQTASASLPPSPEGSQPTDAATPGVPGTPGTPANALGESATTTNPQPPKAADPPAPIAAANAVRSATAAPANEVEEIISTPSQAQVGQAWVRQMPPGTFLVQHTIVPSYGDATVWLQAHANLRRARVVATYLTGQASIQFAVVSGPFVSMAEANSFANSGGVPKDPQIRSARSMKDHFTP